MTTSVNTKLPFLSRLLLIMLFAYTGSSKLTAHDSFLEQLSVPAGSSGMVVPLSYLLLFVETGLVPGLLFAKTLPAASYLSFVLMLLVTLYVEVISASNTKLPCTTCAGVISSLSWKQHLWFNIIFTIIAFYHLYQFNKTKSFAQIQKGES